MKKILSVLLTLLMMFSLCVSAQNPYGLRDDITEFLKEYNVDFSVFAEVFNGEEEEDTLINLESFLSSTMLQTRAYGFNEEQVKALVNSNIDSITRWRKAEYAYIPKCKVTFNGQEVDSTYRHYPLLQFRDIVYFPMTYYDLRFLGVTTNWDEKAKKLTIKKETVENPMYHDYYWSKNHDNGFVYENRELGLYGGVKDCEFEIELNGKEVINKNEEYPLLLFRNVTYFPLTWRFAVDEFGWQYSYDEENGLVINSTKEEKPTKKENEFRVIGYYSGDLFDEPLENLQTDKLTHIMYAFLIPKKDGTCVPFENPDKVKALVEKAHNDGCKVYIAIGGWSYKDVPLVSTFETVSANDPLRQKFIGNIMSIVEEYNFDGVELDWEYPSKASEKNYEKLIVELHEKLREKNKQITAALNGAWSATEGPEVSNYVSDSVLDAFEFINVMSYDMNNEQHSPFWFSNTSIDYWLTRGVSADKIVLGMPLYARPSWMQYRHLVAENTELAYSDYAEINGMKSYYNGLPTLCKKTVLAKEKAGGVMLFDVNEDTNDKYSVVTMIHSVINQLKKDGYLAGDAAEILKKGGSEELTSITGKTYLKE